MSSKHTSLGFTVLFLLSTLASEETLSPNAPTFSYDTPATGLSMTCSLRHREFGIGHRVWADVTIKNLTGDIKPICWSPSDGRFFVSRGVTIRELEDTKVGCTAWPMIRKPILIKSAKEQRMQYVLYLPANASLTFVVQLSRADKPERFKGYLLLDPLPVSGALHGGRKESIRDRFVFSQLVEFSVKSREK